MDSGAYQTPEGLGAERDDAVSTRDQLEKAMRERILVLGGAVCMGLAVGGAYFACPIVKRIWTPTFTLWSGGWCLLWLHSHAEG